MRKLERTGIEVSACCLGTMVFGKTGNPDHEDCVRMIHRALDAGINLVDTADVYGCSETEEIDAIVPPGTDISPLDVSRTPPSLTRTDLRRRPLHERAAV